MTFSIYADVEKEEDIKREILLAWVTPDHSGEANDLRQVANGTGPEAGRMIADAIAAAQKLAHFAFVGGASKVRISVLGHANPGFKQKDGWAHPMLSVSVQIMEYAA